MNLYEVFNFDEGPHFSVAYIRADTDKAARYILNCHIKEHRDKDGDYQCETVWSPRPVDEWKVREVSDTEDVVFVLGAGCR